MNLAQKIRENPRRSFVYALAFCYAVGGLLHLLDVLDLRAEFSKMDPTQKNWTLFLLIADLLTAVLLLKRQVWGLFGFHLVAISQLIAYGVYQDIFGRQDFLMIFHIATLTIFWKIYAREKRQFYDSRQ